MNRKEFNDAYRSNTKVLHKTDVVCCDPCDGRGLIQKYKSVTRQKLGKKYKVQGEPYKNLSKCPECKGVGAFYVPNGKVAGLKLNPAGPSDASYNGFKTDKHTIKLLIEQARRKRNDLAVEYLELMSESSAVSTYLDSFICRYRDMDTGRRYSTCTVQPVHHSYRSFVFLLHLTYRTCPSVDFLCVRLW